MKFISVKLQTYSVQTTHLLYADFITDSFWEMFRKLVVLKEHFSKSLWCNSVLIKGGPAVHSTHFT